MIRCHIKEGGMVFVRAKGESDHMVAEIGMLILSVFRKIHAKNPEAAKRFRNLLIGLLLDPNSPVWETDNNNE